MCKLYIIYYFCLRPQNPSVNFNFCVIVFLPLLCHFLWYKNGGQSSRRRLSLSKLTGTLSSSGRWRGVGVGPESVFPGAGTPCPRSLLHQVSPSVATGASEHGSRTQQADRRMSAETVAQINSCAPLHPITREFYGLLGAVDIKVGGNFCFSVLSKCCVFGRDSCRATVCSCAHRILPQSAEKPLSPLFIRIPYFNQSSASGIYNYWLDQMNWDLF